MQADPQLLGRLRSLPLPAVIAVSGFGGSGKSSLSAQLGQHLGAPVISVDAFIRDTGVAGYACWECFDHDRLEREVLLPLSSGAGSVEFGQFDWQTNAMGSRRTLHDCRRVVVEGVGLLRPSLRKYFAFSIWVRCPIEVAVSRGKRRDRETYGKPQDENWDGIWRRNDEEFYASYRPEEVADYVFDNSVAES